MLIRILAFVLLVTATLRAQQPIVAPEVTPTALTIYNENFAVARTRIDADLHAGSNVVTTDRVTTQLEPDSVVLTDTSRRASSKGSGFHILEQNYDAGVVTQDWLLNKYEGKTIDFQIGEGFYADNHFVPPPVVQGRIIRATGNQPLIDVNGHMQFRLPGTPLFPVVTDGLLLKPTLRWQIESEKAQHLSAELAYVTGGLKWEATYNVVTPSMGEPGKASTTVGEEHADVVGWVSIENKTGTEFPKAQIKLMAGDVAKIVNQKHQVNSQSMTVMGGNFGAVGDVTEKAFDDFHLYDLHRTVSLSNGEVKQIQFIEAFGVTLVRSYTYDGASQFGTPAGSFIQQQNYGTGSENTSVHIADAIKNSQANHLGMALPAGRIRLYRRDTDGQMEFVGESMINHTPAEDTVRITTGNAFDVKGSRHQTDFHINQNSRTVDEVFEIGLTNQKAEPVTVNVVEHLYRGGNWEIQKPSTEWTKLDSHTIQFALKVPSKGEAKLTYAVHYTW